MFIAPVEFGLVDLDQDYQPLDFEPAHSNAVDLVLLRSGLVNYNLIGCKLVEAEVVCGYVQKLCLVYYLKHSRVQLNLRPLSRGRSGDFCGRGRM